MKHYKQLTYEQRCQIYILKKRDLGQQAIADAIGASQSAISRELKRNTGARGYRYQQAQRMSEARRSQAVKDLKMTIEMIALVESKLSRWWSPEQISGWLLMARGERLSAETIYHHIRIDKAAGGSLYCHLRRRGKAYRPRSKMMAGRGYIKNRVSIDERPTIVTEKGHLGDWEIGRLI